MVVLFRSFLRLEGDLPAVGGLADHGLDGDEEFDAAFNVVEGRQIVGTGKVLVPDQR